MCEEKRLDQSNLGCKLWNCSLSRGNLKTFAKPGLFLFNNENTVFKFLI
jgi:hypothetical protein